jgi:hypothetical protein
MVRKKIREQRGRMPGLGVLPVVRRKKMVLCGANSYEEKYYLDEAFSKLPESVKNELQIMCVLYVEDIGGILTLEFDEEGKLDFVVQADEGDYLFDEIGSVLKIKQLQAEKQELLEALELYYQTFILSDWKKRAELLMGQPEVIKEEPARPISEMDLPIERNDK